MFRGLEDMSKKSLRRERARFKELKRLGLLKGDPGDASAQADEAHGAAEKPSHARKGRGNSFIDRIKYIYDHKYKKLLIISVTLFILAIAQIGYQIYETGDFLNKGVSLKGGVTVTIPGMGYDVTELESYLKKELGNSDITVRKLSVAAQQSGMVIDAGITDKAEIEMLLNAIRQKLGITNDDYSVDIIGSALGASFFRETFMAMILAFLFMGIVVFLYFKIPIPTLAVIVCAVCDIVETVAVVNLIGIKISTAGIAAYLMLIGYSVDTDILLTSRVLRRKEGTVLDAVYSAIGTGLTMTITAIIAVVVGLIFAQSDVLKQIMIIVLIGLLFDIINTWIQNTALLRWYLEKRPEKGEIKG